MHVVNSYNETFAQCPFLWILFFVVHCIFCDKYIALEQVSINFLLLYRRVAVLRCLVFLLCRGGVEL